MGGTIPILTQALARSLEDATRFHAFVYAFNTAGAFVGALAAGFYLIPRLGLVRRHARDGAASTSLPAAIFMLLGIRGRAVVSLSTMPPPRGEKRRSAAIEGFASYARSPCSPASP